MHVHGSGHARVPRAWPQRTVKFILPFGAGSATDIAARLIGEKLTARWGKPVIIENRPGGDGLVAINAFTSANDDHVLLYASSASFLAHPYTQEKLPYNLERDLAPIARVTDTVLSVSVPGSSDIKTVADFVKAAKATPEKVQRGRRGRACRSSRSTPSSRARASRSPRSPTATSCRPRAISPKTACNWCCRRSRS